MQLRFRLRALIVFVSYLCAFCTLVGYVRQHNAARNMVVSRLVRGGGTVAFPHQWKRSSSVLPESLEPAGPRIARELLGELAFTSVSYVDVPPEAGFTVKSLTVLRGIECLHLTGGTYETADLRHLKQFRHLKELYVDGSNITDAHLIHFSTLTSLEAIGLSDTRITDHGLRYLKTLRLLSFLDVSHTAITDKGLAHIAQCKGIRDLYLTDTNVGDAGVRWLSAMSNLTVVDLDGTKVTKLGLCRLMKANAKIELAMHHVQADECHGGQSLNK